MELWDGRTSSSQYFDLDIISDNFSAVLEGFWQTLQLSLIGGALALTWGLVLALLRQLPGRPWPRPRADDRLHRRLPRHPTPPGVAAGLGQPRGPRVRGSDLPESIGIPRWFGKPDPFWYGIIALTITYGAYMAEVYRAGIEAVPHGQMEAARSLGMNHGRRCAT